MAISYWPEPQISYCIDDISERGATSFLLGYGKWIWLSRIWQGWGECRICAHMEHKCVPCDTVNFTFPSNLGASCDPKRWAWKESGQLTPALRGMLFAFHRIPNPRSSVYCLSLGQMHPLKLACFLFTLEEEDARLEWRWCWWEAGKLKKKQPTTTSKMKSLEPPCFVKTDLTFKWNSKTWFSLKQIC